MQEKDIDEIAHSFLFDGVDSNRVKQMISADGVSIKRYAVGEMILKPDSHNMTLGIILSGEADVYKHTTDRSVPINTLSAGDIVGAATLFCGEDDKNVTAVIARSECEVTVIEQGTLKKILLQDEKILENYIGYLVRRIRFLVGRMQTFAEGSAENKLLCFLMNNAKNGVYTAEHGMSELARTLSMGRASLYRAVDDLEKKNIIHREGKNIFIKG